MLADERKKEEQRENILNNTEEEHRKGLEKVYGKDRAVASSKIISFNK